MKLSLILLFLVLNCSVLPQDTNPSSFSYVAARVSANGIQNHKSSGPTTLTSPQNIASVTKLFIGIVLMQAIESGKINLDDPINAFLPFHVFNPHFPEDEITVRMLASHTSSIRDYDIEKHSIYLTDKINLKKLKIIKSIKRDFRRWSNNKHQFLTEFLQEALSKRGKYYSRKRFYKERPGATHHYSNLSTSLLALVLTNAVGMELNDYIEQNIIALLGMQNTRWDLTDDRTLPSCFFENKTVVPEYKSILYPAGGLNSTCEDLSLLLAEFLRCLNNDGMLMSKESAELMFSSQLTEQQNTLSGEKNYGLMAEILKEIMGHNGGNYGVTVLFSLNRNKKEGKIFMTPTSSYVSGKLIPEFVEIYEAI